MQSILGFVMVISTKISKQIYNGTDWGESFMFQQFIHTWLGYKLVKVLYVCSACNHKYGLT